MARRLNPASDAFEVAGEDRSDPVVPADSPPSLHQFASEAAKMRDLLRRLERTVVADIRALEDQLAALNHRMSALEQDHDSLRELPTESGEPPDQTLASIRAQVRALNHRVTAIERRAAK